jgi:hypothetical protein
MYHWWYRRGVVQRVFYSAKRLISTRAKGCTIPILAETLYYLGSFHIRHSHQWVISPYTPQDPVTTEASAEVNTGSTIHGEITGMHNGWKQLSCCAIVPRCNE